MVRKYDFPMLWSKNVRQIGNFFDCNFRPPKLLDQHELNRRYNLKINFLSYHQLRKSIDTGAKLLNFKIYNPNLSDIESPRLPLLFKIAIAEPKGCNFFFIRPCDQDKTSSETLQMATRSGMKSWKLCFL